MIHAALGWAGMEWERSLGKSLGFPQACACCCNVSGSDTAAFLDGTPSYGHCSYQEVRSQPGQLLPGVRGAHAIQGQTSHWSKFLGLSWAPATCEGTEAAGAGHSKALLGMLMCIPVVSPFFCRMASLSMCSFSLKVTACTVISQLLLFPVLANEQGWWHAFTLV